MALPIIEQNASIGANDIARALFGNLPPNIADGLSVLLSLGKAIGIAVLIYVIFLIIRSVSQIKYNRRFKELTKNVAEINKKMDVLINKTSKKK